MYGNDMLGQEHIKKHIILVEAVYTRNIIYNYLNYEI